MKNILIIGGSYFAGRVLVEELIREKTYNIFVFNRGNAPLRWKGVTELVGDREKEEDIKKVIPDNQWFAVVDFCAYTPDHIEKMIHCLSGTVTHYIFISTTTVNANSLDLPLQEDALKLSGPQPELGHYADYGYNKWLAECKLEAECKKKQINFTSLRPAVVYGEYNYAPRESYFFDLIAENKPIIIPENGLALFSFVWVVDLARIIIKCLGNQKVFNQAFNVSAEELVSYPRLIEVFKDISGKDFETKTMSEIEIDRKKIPLPFPLDSHLAYSGRKLQKILDFEYTPFVKGMQSTYNYYQKVLEAKNKHTT
jgi:2'-hydroxyisoflavone reductase